MSTCNEITLEAIRKVNTASRKTKVICTLGPACWSVEGLTGLIDAGMNLARFNFSHGDHVTHGATLQRLREAIALRPGCHVGIMLDTKGPEIRTGVIDPSCGGKLKLVRGDLIEVGTDYDKLCTPQYLACSYKSLPKSVKVGSSMLVADGSLMLEVTEIKEASVMAKILNNVSLGDKKNMNLPGAIVDLPTLTEKDIEDLQKFGVANGVDFIAASFVRKASDLHFIREVLGEQGKGIKIISKIENQEGLENYDAILEATDGIMVARGDLGMEIPIEKVFIAQKMMIERANIAGKPVVTATQMLESMITNPRPTRAECADIANAVLDGTDCVMLSGETANGEYPNDAVKYMANTCTEAENILNNDVVFNSIRSRSLAKGDLSQEESIASSAVKTARDVGAKLLVVLTESGNSARLVAKYRPSIPVLVLTHSSEVARQCQSYVRNCKSVVISTDCTNEVISAQIDEHSKKFGYTKGGDIVVCVHGNKGIVKGSTSMVRVLQC